MKIKFLLFSAVFFCCGLSVRAQDWNLKGENCTSIMVGCKASDDGSVITSHTCDGMYRTWVTMEPAADHKPGTMHKVYKGTMHTATPSDKSGLVLAGEIPEVAHTYAYMNTAYPCMNEKQLAIGESTFSGPDTLVNENGMFLIEELERVALQRCDNARDAILLIGDLVAKYGYGDGGECITIADRKEVWQMEIMGEGPDKIGGIWAARRVPDDEVAVSCNVARIGKLERGNKDYFLCSDNVENVAKKYGFWDGTGDFVWWAAFPSDYAGGKNHTEREWYIFNELAPSLHLDLEATDLPFSVKPEQPVSARKVMELLRANYDGCPELDQTKNLLYVKQVKGEDGTRHPDTLLSPLANPWMGGLERELYNFLQPGTVTFHRGVAMSWCSYSFVIQCRSWLPDEVGAVCWFSFENPGQSPRIPIFAGTSQLPSSFSICGHHGFNENAALWQYRKANKLAQVRWGQTGKMMMEKVLGFEERMLDEAAAVEKSAMGLLPKGKKKVAILLNDFTASFAEDTRKAWQEMEHKFWEFYWTGF
ncbi:MAG: C69 family dipeptidase [Bacteroidales bacterium]|nr:C69 family dipeptidase [Bacteroidales bacterium]